MMGRADRPKWCWDPPGWRAEAGPRWQARQRYRATRPPPHRSPGPEWTAETAVAESTAPRPTPPGSRSHPIGHDGNGRRRLRHSDSGRRSLRGVLSRHLLIPCRVVRWPASVAVLEGKPHLLLRFEDRAQSPVAAAGANRSLLGLLNLYNHCR